MTLAASAWQLLHSEWISTCTRVWRAHVRLARARACACGAGGRTVVFLILPGACSGRSMNSRARPRRPRRFAPCCKAMLVCCELYAAPAHRVRTLHMRRKQCSALNVISPSSADLKSPARGVRGRASSPHSLTQTTARRAPSADSGASSEY
jgi:hypothetical protein